MSSSYPMNAPRTIRLARPISLIKLGIAFACYVACIGLPAMTMLSVALLPRTAVAQLFESSVVGTDFDFITEDDPSTFEELRYVSRGRAEMPDKRGEDAPLFRDAFLFEASFEGDKTIQIFISAEFKTKQSAESEAKRYVQPLGKLPNILRSGVNRLIVHRGGPTTTAFSDIGLIVVYSDNASRRIKTHDLEETIFHESVHAAWDAKYAASKAWRRAQAADGAYATRYAQRLPEREDLAESTLFAYTVLYNPDRIPDDDLKKIRELMPNRIAFVADRIPVPSVPNEDSQSKSPSKSPSESPATPPSV